MEKKLYHWGDGGYRRGHYFLYTHNGTDTHPDGSPFYGLHIFHNRKALDKAIAGLRENGYREER